MFTLSSLTSLSLLDLLKAVQHITVLIVKKGVILRLSIRGLHALHPGQLGTARTAVQSGKTHKISALSVNMACAQEYFASVDLIYHQHSVDKFLP